MTAAGQSSSRHRRRPGSRGSGTSRGGAAAATLRMLLPPAPAEPRAAGAWPAARHCQSLRRESRPRGLALPGGPLSPATPRLEPPAPCPAAETARKEALLRGPPHPSLPQLSWMSFPGSLITGPQAEGPVRSVKRFLIDGGYLPPY